MAELALRLINGTSLVYIPILLFLGHLSVRSAYYGQVEEIFLISRTTLIEVSTLTKSAGLKLQFAVTVGAGRKEAWLSVDL